MTDMHLGIKVTLDGKQTVGEAQNVAKSVENIGVSADRGFTKASQGVRSISEQLKNLQGLAVAGLGVSGLGDLIKLTDEYGQMASRIKMATESTAEYEAVQARLLETASNTYRPLAEAQEMYLRTADALKSMGYNTQQALDVSDSFSYLLVTNAASGERAASAIQAYSKALQKGEVDAMAWQSILAATPTLVDKIASATGKTAEEIRRMGAEGKLALEDLNEGLRQSLLQNMEDAANMPITVADAFTKLRTRLQAYLGTANEATGATETITSALGSLTSNVGNLMVGGFAALGGALVAMTKNLLLSAGAAVKNKVELFQAANANRAAAQAALTNAEAEMAAAEAALMHERAAVAMGTAVSTSAATEQRAAAASAALATAQALNAAASGVLMLGLRGIGSFMLGPWGLVLTAATTALAFFGDKTEAVKSKLADLAEPLDAVTEKFNAMSRSAQSAELGSLGKQIDEAKKSAHDLATALRKSVDDELNAWHPFAPLSAEAKAEFEAIRAEAQRGVLSEGGNGEALTRQIEHALHIPEAIRAEWIQQVGLMDAAKREADGLASRHSMTGIDPLRLGRMLKDAEQEDASAYLELAEEMEEKYLHY